MRNYFWPSVKTLESAKEASTQGVWAAGLIAALGCVLAVWAAMSATASSQGYVILGVMHALIFAPIALGILKGKFWVAMLGLCIYSAGELIKFVETGTVVRAWLVITILLAFVNSIRGLHALRKLRAQSATQADEKSPPTAA